ncbi:hypothetical protein JG687_00015002 [Phytophthora cactorum]|uniref:Uncharacterized protein n=1 Tax=Phytophthora cactorum TaxID=29920 RepID=A0A8T1ADJ5_9STRA|nr:hypothetical protein PC112_g19701 [Phytophthora cactorum]KAG2877630.1 hypothetical protein PC115_g23315 [Phytophthora cactorum]KAG2996399.1 hypothetical protein PC120_g21510 [Phytophthora cactorum]KAG3132720.1 hypothetical protein C6341_g22792 [Phytophthora cactorum]KAG6949238.1 hypothetical protein JG687_00015002 [Phytophthora cactorum]
MRRRTRIGQTTLADAATQAEKFSVAVREKMKELKFSKVFNADQTGAHRGGAKTVWVSCAGKSKVRVTTMLLGDSDGNKLDHFLVFETKPS